MGLTFLRISRPQDLTLKSFGQKLFSRSVLSPSSSKNTNTHDTEGESSTAALQGQVSLNLDADRGCLDAPLNFSLSTSPPHCQDSRASLTECASPSADSLSVATAATFLYLSTDDMAHADGDDTKFLRAVLNYGDDDLTTDISPSSILKKRQSAHQQQITQFPGDRGKKGRIFLSQQAADRYARSDVDSKSHGSSYQIWTKSELDGVESDSEDEYGNEENDGLTATSQSYRDEGLSTAIATQDQTPATLGHPVLSSSTQEGRQIRAPVNLGFPCQRALYTCTLLKTHVELASTLASDPEWGERLLALAAAGYSYSTDKLKFPRSSNPAFTLFQHASTHGLTRNLRVALARSAVMRKLRSQSITTADQEELSYFTLRYGSYMVPADRVAKAIHKVRMANAEAAMTLPFAATSQHYLINYNHVKSKLRWPRFNEREVRNDCPEYLSQDEQLNSRKRDAVVRDQIPTSSTTRPKRAAPWLVSFDTFSQSRRSATAEGFPVVQSFNQQNVAVLRHNQTKQAEKVICTRHQAVRDNRILEHGFKRDTLTSGPKRASVERDLELEAYKLGQSRRVLQEARDRRAVTRRSMLLAEPNYGAGNPLLSKSLPRRGSALDIRSAKSHELIPKLHVPSSSSSVEAQNFRPEVQRLRICSLTPRPIDAATLQSMPPSLGSSPSYLQHGSRAFEPAPYCPPQQFSGLPVPAGTFIMDHQPQDDRSRPRAQSALSKASPSRYLGAAIIANR